MISLGQATQMAFALSQMKAVTVAVETYSGSSAYGPVFAASANAVCCVDVKSRLVRNQEGEEVLSELTLHALPADAAKFLPESRVTLATKISTVISTSPKTYRGNMVDVEVACT